MTVCDLTYDHEFVVLACDGIWDVMSNQEVIDFCRDRLAAGREPEMVSLILNNIIKSCELSILSNHATLRKARHPNHLTEKC